MNPKNKLDKVAYYMLNIAGILVLGSMGATGDATDSGGLFPRFVVAVFMSPFICCWMFQAGMHVLGYIQYENNAIESARALGKLNCIFYLMWCICFGYDFFNRFRRTGSEGLIELIITGICVVYMLVPLVLFSINTHKKKK